MGIRDWDEDQQDEFLSSLESAVDRLSVHKIVTTVYRTAPEGMTDKYMVPEAVGSIMMENAKVKVEWKDLVASREAVKKIVSLSTELRDLISEARPTKLYEINATIIVRHCFSATITTSLSEDDVKDLVYQEDPAGLVDGNFYAEGVEVESSDCEMDDAEIEEVNVNEG